MFRIIFPALPFLIAVIVPTIAALAPETSHQRGLAAVRTVSTLASGIGVLSDR